MGQSLWISPALKAGKPESKMRNFDHPAAAKMFKTATGTVELSSMTMCQTRHSGASIDRVRGFRTLYQVQNTRSVESVSSVTRCDKSSRLAANCHCLPRPLRDKLETVAERTEVLLMRKLQVWRLPNVFGGYGFVTLATHPLSVRGRVLTLKFLSRIRQDVSAGKCVAGMSSHSRQHASCSPEVVSASAATVNLLRRACTMPWILGQGRAENPDSHGTASHGVGPGGFFAFLDHRGQKRTLLLVGNADSRDSHRVALKLQCFRT